MPDGFKFTVRAARPEDEGFVADGYVNTARMCMQKGRLSRIPNGAFSHYHREHVRSLIRNCETRVATTPEDDGTLYGFSITEAPRTIHMVYVSRSHWRMGIGKALLGPISVSEFIFSMWPNTAYGSTTEWIWPFLEKQTFLPYWMVANGK